jgi:hypothetical protein
VSRPHFGHTKSGVPVHRHHFDYFKIDTRWQRFNKRIAMTITNVVFTMNTFWVFSLISLSSLPAVLVSAHILPDHLFPSWLIAASFIALIAWIAQTYLQLVLLPALGVGQNLQGEASNARSEKQFDDTEVILDGMNLETEGGLTVLEKHLSKQDELLTQIRDALGKDEV